MKKLLTVLIALSMVASGFAAEPLADVNTVDFSGEASVTFGIDVDTHKTGFKNETDVELIINLLPGEMSKSTEGTGVWGELLVKVDGDTNFKSEDPGAAVALSADGVIVDVATIHIGDAYVGIKSGDFDYGGDFNYPNAMGFDNGDSLNGKNIYYMEDSPAKAFGYDQGLTLGYGADMFSVEAAVRTKANIKATPGDITSIQIEKVVPAGETYTVPKGTDTVQYVDVDNKNVTGTVVKGAAIVYRVTYVANDASNYWTNDYALGFSAMVTPIDDLMIQFATAYGVSGEKEKDLSMFSGIQYKLPVGMFSITPVATWNFYLDHNTATNKGTTTQNALGFGLNFGWGESMDGDSVLYGFYDTKLAYVGADEGDGTILPGISVFTSLDLTQAYTVSTTDAADKVESNMANTLPLMIMLHTGDIVPNLSAQVLFSSNLGINAKKNAYATTKTAAAAAAAASNKMATQIGFAADYDIMVGDLTITPSAGILVGLSASEENVASNAKTTSGTSLMPRVATNVAGLVPNTTFTIEWGSAAYSTGKATNEKDVTTSENGEFTFKAKIAL